MNAKLTRPNGQEGNAMKYFTSVGNAATALFRFAWGQAKYLAIVGLIVNLYAANAHAASQSVKMSFSGNSANSATSLQQPNTSNDQDTFAGDGTLGPFTVTNLRAISNSPGFSSSCSASTQLFLTELAGAGVFRFQDGSLLEVNLTEGGDCIDLITNTAHCTLTFKIIGGTGRFQHAAGVLTMTETVTTVASDAFQNPVFFAATGEYTGTISGLDTENSQDTKE